MDEERMGVSPGALGKAVGDLIDSGSRLVRSHGGVILKSRILLNLASLLTVLHQMIEVRQGGWKPDVVPRQIDPWPVAEAGALFMELKPEQACDVANAFGVSGKFETVSELAAALFRSEAITRPETLKRTILAHLRDVDGEPKSMKH